MIIPETSCLNTDNNTINNNLIQYRIANILIELKKTRKELDTYTNRNPRNPFTQEQVNEFNRKMDQFNNLTTSNHLANVISITPHQP